MALLTSRYGKYLLLALIAAALYGATRYVGIPLIGVPLAKLPTANVWESAAQDAPAQSVAIAEQNAAQPTHRPVTVHYVDSTFDGTQRTGSLGEKPAYYIAVSYVSEEDASEISAGQKRLSVTTALGNISGPRTTVEREALTLVSDTGERYQPAADEASSDVLGVPLNADQGVYGFLIFEVPASFGPGWLEWCPDGVAPCEQPLRTPLP